MVIAMRPTVAIDHVHDYAPTPLKFAVDKVLTTSGLTISPGQRVLVKPNLVNGKNARHCTTHPAMVKAVCAWLLDHDALVTVADSPALGPAAYVAHNSGLTQVVGQLGLKVTSLKRAMPLELSHGGTIGLSQDALDADLILNMPKLKVHCQMVMTGAVKNLFGCVVGFRKAMAHNHLGHNRKIFRAMLMDVYAALPHCHHLMDGVHAMHKDGPINGEPFPLGLLSASTNGIAMDTAAYTVLGLTPDRIPLWDEALTRNISGANIQELDFPIAPPSGFDILGFTMSPERELSFAPSRVIKGRIRSLLKYFKKQ
ncbi:hypothetical protein SYK_12760 [Pseudodesulfovibrio nedwellii]|uniref:DUF362 domain-containing protein n=2 Tax=Pseudodesulfovibrio nedwellii TaxID=2973072 RepID=A0ABN6S4J6_9BACT|nr:hypothetical protein SYK_12760 [Pseudodesulfovibrio nedwellii]